MIKKKDFINRIIEIIRKDLMRILPNKEFLSTMYEDFERYIRRKYEV